jgi:ribosomal protein S18 acetylase RimI-like enzyme
MSEARHDHLRAASNPRRANDADVPALARLFAAAFAADPVFDWIARRGPKRAQGLERFFFWVLKTRAVPFGEVWLADDGGAAAAWLPPDAPASPGGFFEQLRLLPMFVRLCGIPRLGRGSALADAMEKHHPKDPHYYLSFVAVAPRLQGMGLGSAILAATLRRADAEGWNAYLENSNPKNTRLYERHGFSAGANISPRGAPPLLPMWRDARKVS